MCLEYSGCPFKFHELIFTQGKYSRVYDKQECFKYYEIFKHYQHITINSLAKTQVTCNIIARYVSRLINYSIMKTIARDIS